MNCVDLIQNETIISSYRGLIKKNLISDTELLIQENYLLNKKMVIKTVSRNTERKNTCLTEFYISNKLVIKGIDSPPKFIHEVFVYNQLAKFIDRDLDLYLLNFPIPESPESKNALIYSSWNFLPANGFLKSA
ncbi:hypothetical protein MXB_2872 [Myxobolus squamalis]|nr:hypothetical protein MXB_2872 [Myxobolus squamalis]